MGRFYHVNFFGCVSDSQGAGCIVTWSKAGYLCLPKDKNRQKSEFLYTNVL